MDVTKELDIDGRQAIVIERQVLESARREVQYELYVTYENNYLLEMLVYDDTELDTAIDIVKGLKLTATDLRKLRKNQWKNICIRSEKALMYRSLP